MKELEEKEIKEIEELGRLTTDELQEKKRELKLYECEMYRRRRTLGIAIRVAAIIDIYKKGGFGGLHKYFYRMMYHTGPEGERECMEDDIPF
ncbi:hypothetical protein ES705_39199 [subsurface metagenome]|jgi:hypothetical protein